MAGFLTDIILGILPLGLFLILLRLCSLFIPVLAVIVISVGYTCLFALVIFLMGLPVVDGLTLVFLTGGIGFLLLYFFRPKEGTAETGKSSADGITPSVKTEGGWITSDEGSFEGPTPDPPITAETTRGKPAGGWTDNDDPHSFRHTTLSLLILILVASGAGLFIWLWTSFFFEDRPGSLKADPPRSEVAEEPPSQPGGLVAGKDGGVDLGEGIQMEFRWIDSLDVWVGKFEVTNEEFRRFRPNHDSRQSRGMTLDSERQPAVWVSHDDARAFASWMSRRSDLRLIGARARLPTGGEWTAIARCGTSRVFPWGDSWPPTRGNYNDQTAMETLGLGGIQDYKDGFAVSAPVDWSGANEWGLHGVGGNVWEWTNEQEGSFRIIRGGSWLSNREDGLRVEDRRKVLPNRSHNDLGFRLVIGLGP